MLYIAPWAFSRSHRVRHNHSSFGPRSQTFLRYAYTHTLVYTRKSERARGGGERAREGSVTAGRLRGRKVGTRAPRWGRQQQQQQQALFSRGTPCCPPPRALAVSSFFLNERRAHLRALRANTCTYSTYVGITFIRKKKYIHMRTYWCFSSILIRLR